MRIIRIELVPRRDSGDAPQEPEILYELDQSDLPPDMAHINSLAISTNKALLIWEEGVDLPRYKVPCESEGRKFVV